MTTNSIHPFIYAALAADPTTRLGRLFSTGPRQPDPPDGEGEGEEPTPPTVSRDAYDKLLKQRKADQQRIREFETKQAETEAFHQKIEDEKARKAQDWAKLEKTYQKQLAEKDEMIAEFQSREENRARGERRSRFATEIAKKAGIDNTEVVTALLPSLGLEDDAPEEYGTNEVRGAIKALQGLAPQLFNGTTTIKPPPGGGTRPPDSNSPDYWRDRAKNRSQRQMTAYDHAIGRGKQ